MPNAPKSPKIDKAMELLRSGDAESFTEAARRTGASYPGVNQRWRREEGDRELPAREKALAEEVEVGDKPAADTPEIRTLARKVADARKGRGAAQAEAKEANRRLADADQEIETLRETLALVQAVEEAPRPDWLLSPKKKRSTHTGTLMALFSDFHTGEVVEPSEMNWYNAYNPGIAELRIRRFFERTIIVSRQYLAGVKYDGIVMPNMGDTVSGDIHDEFRETNELTNFEAVPFVVPLLAEGIGMFADEFGKVHVPCVPGNHPRDSRKPRYKKRSAHNADTLISKLIAREFENDDRVTFDIPDGISADFQVYDTRFRIEHGDEAKGGGGIQGAMLPVALRTHRVRKQAQAEGRPFDILMMGHWHQLMNMPAKGFIVNGAGKGYDEYARGKGFEPEPPQQFLFTVTPEHGISAQLPLFVGHRKSEGW